MSEIQERARINDVAKNPSADHVVSDYVPVKYRGTAQDLHDMSVLGKKQELRRQFKFSTMLSFASTVMVAWEFFLLISPFGLEDGGTPSIFWGLFICPFVMMPMYASLAEIASMSPTAGGQYHWVSEFAPPRLQRRLSYAVGWLIALGWQTFLCGVAYVCAGLILGVAVLDTDGAYQIKKWHQTVLTISLVTLCGLFNVFFNIRLPLIEVLCNILHVLGVFVVIIPLWVMAPHGTVHETIFHFTANSGWKDVNLAAVIGIVPMIGLLIGYDCTVHMSEEVEDASTTIPKVIMWCTLSNAIMLIVVGWTYIFCLGDLKAVLNSNTYEPAIQVFFNATQSRGGTTVMVGLVVIVFIAACIGQVATASRQLWSFARDQGVPGSRWLAYVTTTTNVPLNAIIVTVAITSILSLINLGSTEAFNAFNSLGTVSLLSSYTITILCLVWRRIKGPELPQRRWSLGQWGIYFNAFSLCFTLPMIVFYVWPLEYPVTAANMNWASAMFGATLIVSLIYYVSSARHNYEGPVVLIKRE